MVPLLLFLHVHSWNHVWRHDKERSIEANWYYALIEFISVAVSFLRSKAEDVGYGEIDRRLVDDDLDRSPLEHEGAESRGQDCGPSEGNAFDGQEPTGGNDEVRVRLQKLAHLTFPEGAAVEENRLGFRGQLPQVDPRVGGVESFQVGRSQINDDMSQKGC